MKWLKNRINKYIKEEKGTSNIIEAFFAFIMLWAVVSLGVYLYTGYTLQQDVASVSNAIGRNLTTMGCKSERASYLNTVSSNLTGGRTTYAVIINVNGVEYASKPENGGFSVGNVAWKHGEELTVIIRGKTSSFMIFPFPVKDSRVEFSTKNLIQPASSGEIIKYETVHHMIEEDRCFN